MKIFKNIFLFILVIVVSILLAIPTNKFYQTFTKIPVGFGGFLIPSFWYNFMDGINLSYIFSLTFLFTAFGGVKKYWWIGIGLIPTALFEAYFDLEHIYFPIAVGLVGWAIGSGLSWLVWLLKSRKKRKIMPSA